MIRHGFKDFIILSFLLTIFIIILYTPVLKYDFVWDDEEYLKNNQYLKSLKNIPDFFTNPYSFAKSDEAGIYRPLRNIIWSIGLSFSDKASFFHLLNIILHALTASLLFLLLFKINSLSKYSAFLLAALFAFHPLNTETVCWIKAIDDILASIFILIMIFALYCKRNIITFISYTLALLSKESAFFFFLLPGLFNNPSFNLKSYIKKSLPYIIITAVYFTLRTISLKSVNQSPYMDGAKTIFYMGGVWLKYLSNIIFPFNLRINYMGWHPNDEYSILLILLFWLFSISLLKIIINRQNINYFLIFLCSLLPISNLIPMMQWMADRFFYLPFALLLLFLSRFSLFRNNSHHKIMINILLIALLGSFSLSRSRMKVWQNNFTVGQEILKHNPYSFSGLILILNYNEKNNLYKENIRILDSIKDSPDAKSDWYNNYYSEALKQINNSKSG